MPLHIDGVEVMTAPDVAMRAGLSVDALRKRMERGLLALHPHVTIARQHFYAVSDVHAALRRGLGE